ncbi:MAG: hypothetical protein AAF591_19325 [Verrucomicrobiota bacterium]
MLSAPPVKSDLHPVRFLPKIVALTLILVGTVAHAAAGAAPEPRYHATEELEDFYEDWIEDYENYLDDSYEGWLNYLDDYENYWKDYARAWENHQIDHLRRTNLQSNTAGAVGYFPISGGTVSSVSSDFTGSSRALASVNISGGIIQTNGLSNGGEIVVGNNATFGEGEIILDSGPSGSTIGNSFPITGGSILSDNNNRLLISSGSIASVTLSGSQFRISGGNTNSSVNSVSSDPPQSDPPETIIQVSSGSIASSPNNQVFNLSGGYTLARGAGQVTASFATFNTTHLQLQGGSIDTNLGSNGQLTVYNSLSLSGGTIRPLSVQNGGNGNLELDANASFSTRGATFDLQGGNLLDTDGAQNNVIVSGGRVLNAALIDANVTLTGSSIRPSDDGTLRVLSLDNSGAGGQIHDLTASGGSIVFDLFSNPGKDPEPVGTHASGVIVDLASITSNVEIIINDAGEISFSLRPGDTFDLFDFNADSAVDGTFDFSGAPLQPGYTWDTSQFASQGIIQVALVPEPTTPLLLLLTTSLLALPRRPRRCL